MEARDTKIATLRVDDDEVRSREGSIQERTTELKNGESGAYPMLGGNLSQVDSKLLKRS